MKVKGSITLDEDIWAKLEELAPIHRTNVSALINKMLADGFGFVPPRELRAKLPEQQGDNDVQKVAT